MDLWIRSQSRMNLVKVSEIWIDDTDMVDRDCVSIMTNSNFSFELGVYKTKERALEVLDEIQKKINLINLGHDFGSPMIDLENPTYIYEMPKE